MPATAPLLAVDTDGNRTTAYFARPTRLTEETAPAVAQEFAALVAGRARPDLTLDLGAVEFLASLGLARLLRLHGDVRAAGGTLTLVNLPPTVRQVFAATRLDRVFAIAPAAVPA